MSPRVETVSKRHTTVALGLSPALHLLVSILIWPLLTVAQDDGSVMGRVQVAGGAPLAGAKVILTHQGTQAKDETVSAEDGSFAFTELAPGPYVLQVEASGFEAYRTDIEVGTEELRALRIKLKLRAVEEEVIVKPDTSDDRLSPEGNTESMKIDETFFNGLPFEVDYLQSFIAAFTSPAAQGNEGTSVVVDGVDGGELDMPSSAIRSVKINRNPYSAEFQHPGSARAEITTKHGHGHRYYGSAAFFARNSALDARNALADTKPDLNRRFVEGSLGGPLLGKNSNFFLAGERLMDDKYAVVNALDTVALTGPVNTNVPTPQGRDHVFARMQWLVTDMQSLSLSYTFADQSKENNAVGALTLPEQGFSGSRHTHSTQFIDSVAFSPRLRNELTLVFKDQESRTGSIAEGSEILVSGAFIGGPSQSFDGKERRGFGIQDTATYIRGRHSLLFGTAIRTDWWQVFDATNFGGTFKFTGLDQYRNVVQNQLGTPDLFQISQGNPKVSFVAQQTTGFAQDQMRVLANLGLTFGLRYDWQNTLDDRNNPAPRVSIAYAPGKRKKTVLRAGAGIFYDNLPRPSTEHALLQDGVHVREIDISHPSYPNPFLNGNPVSQPPSISRISSTARSPYLIQASAGVERELWGGTWLSLEYSFLHGVHLFRVRDVNAALPSEPSVRPDPNFLNIEEVESTAFLRGYALSLIFRGGLGKRLKGYAQYIFSEYTNDTSGTQGVFSFPANNYDLRGEIGPADFDQRHRINFAGTVQLPWGFRAGSILSAASGVPFNITTGIDVNGDTLDRPVGVTRNTGRSPGTVQLDLRVTKVFSFERASEGKHRPRRTMELSVDAFNAINHMNVDEIIGVVGSPLFGRAASAGPARTFQLSMKYSF